MFSFLMLLHHFELEEDAMVRHARNMSGGALCLFFSSRVRIPDGHELVVVDVTNYHKIKMFCLECGAVLKERIRINKLRQHLGP
jgi:hypothetical protein